MVPMILVELVYGVGSAAPAQAQTAKVSILVDLDRASAQRIGIGASVAQVTP